MLRGRHGTQEISLWAVRALNSARYEKLRQRRVPSQGENNPYPSWATPTLWYQRHTFTNAKRSTMARKNDRNTVALQKSLPGMPPPPASVAASPEPVGTVTATCTGECRSSTQHTVERLRQPDGSIIVHRTCNICDARERITISKFVAERVLNADQPKAAPISKAVETAHPSLPIDSECRTADNGDLKR